MENIDFVMWMVLYPITTAICRYIDIKERKINDEEPYSEKVKILASLTSLLVYVFVANALYN